MQLRYQSFDTEKQVRCPNGHLPMRYEVFLDFDPVPYPVPDNPVAEEQRGQIREDDRSRA